MTNFKKIIIASAAVLTLSAGGAATAQPMHDGDRGYQQSGYQQNHRDDHGYQDNRDANDPHLSPAYIHDLDWRITREARAGHISWKQAGRLHGDQRLAMQMAVKRQHTRLAPWEYERLMQSVHNIEVGTSRYADNGARPNGDRDHDGYRR